MKKKCLECVVLLLFIFALTHGIIQNTQPLKETKEVQTEYEEKTSQVTEKSQETEPEVQDLENQILRTASGKFFQKYPVDEAFMGWIETKYGSGVLQSLYTQLENGNQDPDLWYRFTGNSMHVLWLMYCRQQQYMSYSYEDVIWKEASDPACIRLDFVGDICLDEAFMGWIETKYGSGVLQSLYTQLENGNQDPDLWYRFTGNSMHVLWLMYCRQQQYMSYSYEDVIWKEASDPACIRLDFVGDICLDENWCTGKTAKNHMADYFSDEVKKELISADFTMANNEFAYTTRGQRQVGKAYCFRADPKDAGFLRTLGIDMVSVANNHVFDYGEQGFLDTLDALHAAGIPYSGGGRNLTEASAVRYVVTGGRKIAIVSATEIERFYHFTQKAQKEKPGVLKTQQEEVWKKELKRAKKNSDYVIAYVHWGTEGKIHYGQDQTEIADLCVKAGADAVIGGHPHRLQGVEFIKNVPVAYSVENFWFSTGKLYTTIAQIQIDDSGSLKLRMIPCIQDSLTTSILTEKKQIKAFYHYLADISNHVGIDEDGFFYPYKNVEKPGVSPYAYTSGRRYGQYFDDVDLDLKSIDIVGNLQ